MTEGTLFIEERFVKGKRSEIRYNLDRGSGKSLNNYSLQEFADELQKNIGEYNLFIYSNLQDSEMSILSQSSLEKQVVLKRGLSVLELEELSDLIVGNPGSWPSI